MPKHFFVAVEAQLLHNRRVRIPTLSKSAPRVAVLAGLFLACLSGVLRAQAGPTQTAIFVSVADQKLAIVQNGVVTKRFPVSTSKYGLGDRLNSFRTPLGQLRVCSRLGHGLPSGAVLKNRRATGEVLRLNAPGRDPIVTRILWLEGLEPGNHNAKGRCIYIHGTPQEMRIGDPVSYGCIRMRSKDVIEVFNAAPIGTTVTILKERMPRLNQGPITLQEILLADSGRKKSGRDFHE